MLYSGIANVLRDIFQAPRSQKADRAADFLTGLEPEMVCPCVRLLLGELWPPWEDRDMDIGPEALLAALKEVSDEDVLLLKERLGEMGSVAEAALQRKGQHPLSTEPLEAVSVYERLRRISEMSGEDSEHRKNAVLRGLFLEATPLEGKYIARTALRNMLVGIGPQTMISALSSAFHCDHHEVQKAYNIMPEMGLVARAACLGKLDETVIQPKRPIKPMIMRPGKAVVLGAFLPKYAGLRVQVHKAEGEIFVFTSRQRDITWALNGLLHELCDLTRDLIFDADLIGFEEGRICSQTEMLWYINRRHLSQRSRVSPALLAYDLIYLDGEDLTGLGYEERRRKLLAALGEPKGMPFQGISPAEERALKSEDEVEDYLLQVRRAGGKGLMARDLGAPYLSGGCSEHDFIRR
jgi:DNA ligase-1